MTSSIICLSALLLIASPALAEGDAAGLFADAKASLAKADFDGALALMEKAAAAEPDNQEYMQELRLLKRVIKIRSRLDMQASPIKWERTASSLRSYYYTNKIYCEALAIDKACFDKVKTPDNAARYGKTMLQMDKNEEAAQFLADIPAEFQSERTAVLHGIACARLGKMDEAGRIAADLKEEEEASPVQSYERACLYSLLGQQDAAAKMLVTAFETMLPSRLDDFKKHVRESGDLAAFFNTTMVAKVMATESKVAESKCSSGSSCGKCPSRGGCSKAAADDKKDGGSCESEKKG